MVHALTDRHFSVQNVNNKRLLTITGAGNITLVYFRKNGSPNCSKFDPMFQNLSRMDTRVDYAVLDLSRFPQVLRLSRNTVSPIQKVPWMVLYVGGVPGLKYTGDWHPKAISGFISSALPQISARNQQASFVQHSGAQQGGGRGQQRSQKTTYTPTFAGGPPNIQFSTTGRSGRADAFTALTEEDHTLAIPPETIPKNEPWLVQEREY